MTTMRPLPLLVALALVAGCATPADHYHTLRPATASAPVATLATPSACSRSVR